MTERKKTFKYSPVKTGPLYTDTIRALAVGETAIYRGTYHIYGGMRNASCRLEARGSGKWAVKYINKPDEGIKGVEVTRLA